MTITTSLPDAAVLDLPVPATKPTTGTARIAGVGTATTERSYSQPELLDLFHITDPKVRSVFLNSAIERRHLTIPPEAADGTRPAEAQGELLAKHRRVALDMGARAVRACLENSGIELSDIDYLCCVTTTGFLTPGISALLIKEMGISSATSRVDVVGMGCNAGLNALNATPAGPSPTPARSPSCSAPRPARRRTSWTRHCAPPS